MPLKGSYLALATFASFIVLFAYSLIQLVNIDRAFRMDAVEMNLWVATQADREAQNLLLTLYRVSLDRNLDDVLLRFDILYSRVGLMMDQPQAEYFQSIGAGDQVRQAQAMLDDLDQTILSDNLDFAEIVTLIPPTIALSSVVHDIALAAMQDGRLDRHDRREEMLHAFRLLLLAVFGVFAMGMVMAGLLWRNMRRVMRTQEELTLHRAQLEETVAARTSELRDLLEAERRSKEVYRSFIVTVSHQFRTPVSIIHMIAQRQLRNNAASLPERLQPKFSRILDAAQRLERLLSGFLHSVSSEGQAITLSRRAVDFNQIAETAAVQTQEADPGRILDIRLSETPLPVDGDPVLLEQVVLNLLSNAMKYSHAPAPVRLETWRDGTRVLCRVSDQGLGIPESAQAAIFDRFYRAPNAHTLPGVGVGLSLARDIVLLHDGEITFTSHMGEGTMFIVALPALGDNTDERADNGDDPLRRG